MHSEIEYVERAFLAGAMGYVLKSEKEEQIVEAMYAITHGKKYISSSLKDNLVEKMLWEDAGIKRTGIVALTEREREILILMGKGLTTRGISNKLGIGVSTIGTYRDRLKKKLNLTTNSELVCFAIKNGMA